METSPKRFGAKELVIENPNTRRKSTVRRAWTLKAPARVLRLVLGLLIVAPGAFGGEREYMDGVGKLLGLSRSPAVIREYCARRVPEAKANLQALYDAWFERNKQQFERIDGVLQRADKYMRQRNDPSGPHSIAEVLASVTKSVEQYLDQRTSEDAVSFCAEYPALLKHKDSEFATEIPRLIKSLEVEERSFVQGQT
jgi:hypothetical protein